MYDIQSNLIIGFHGCDKTTRNSLLNYPDVIKKSEKPFDWLGHGMYFWENNAARAMQWATEKALRETLREPAIIGAILNLGYCCDLMDSRFIQLLKPFYTQFKNKNDSLGKPLPENKDIRNDPHKDKILRVLDCSVIEFMHTRIEEQYKKDKTSIGFSNYKIFDSTRGAFTEGGPIFEGAGIFEKTHIQICIRNPNCIKGFFLPRKEIEFSI